MIRTLRALLGAALFFTAAHTAATAAALPSLPAPAESFEAGSIHVDRYGSGAQTLVFIPGLSCGPWEWAEAIGRFSKTATVYALTLDGFDGRTYVPNDDLFATFTHDVYALLDARKIERPVVIGHSLGGTLAFALAQAQPNRIAGFVSLDGLPVFPTMAQAPEASRKQAAAAMASQIAGETHDQMLAYDVGYMRSATLQSDLVQPAATLEATSDPKATAAWLQADLDADLRPGLPAMNTPGLLLMPYASPSPYTLEQTTAFYQSLVHGAPRVTVVPIEGARHFAMLDQPAAVDAAITRFLASLSR
jgi:pimeloyl-ACP methyl ester carboxylesterase